MLIFIPLSGTKYFFNGSTQFPWGFWFRVGYAYFLFVVYFSGFINLSFIILYKYYKKLNNSTEKYRIKLLLLGFFVVCFGVVDFLPGYGVNIYPFGYLPVFLYLIIVAYAIIKHHLLDIRIILTRTGIFIFVFTFVLALPFYIGYRFNSWFWAAVCGIGLGLTGPTIYRWLKQKAEDRLLAQQKHYQQLLRESGRELLRKHDLNRLVQFIAHVVKRLVRVKFAAVFLFDEKTKQYCLQAVRDHQEFPNQFSLNPEHTVVKLLIQTKISLAHEDTDHWLPDLKKTPVYLTVPAFIDNKLQGFLMLGEKIDKTIFSEPDILAIETFVSQAALAIDYCLFLEQFSLIQKQLAEADKLAYIGGMVNGMSHQFRNKLNAMNSVATSFRTTITNNLVNIIDKDTYAWLIECCDDMEKVVKTGNQLVNGVISCARLRSSKDEYSSFSLNSILEDVLLPIKLKHRFMEKKFDFDFFCDFGNDDVVYGKKSLIIEALVNLVDNSFESIDAKRKYCLSPEEAENYQPFIKISLNKKPGNYIIAVSDNGGGIKEENFPKIFAPYFTTKASIISGAGIGMFTVKQYVQNQGGKIWFTSQYMKQTTFFIEMPMKLRIKD
jgi:signal transduction histidine kinase